MQKFLLASLGLAAMAASPLALAAPHPQPSSLHLISTIAIPGQPLKNFDISAFSEPQHFYGFSDRTNHAVDFIDASTNRFVGRVGGFSHGPNGLVAVGNDQFWAGDGDSRLRVIDIPSRKIVATIDTGGKQRIDEVAYDPKDQLVIAANPGDNPPFVTFVSTKPGHRIEGKLPLPQATDGLEQPLWNPADGLVYLSIPVLHHHKKDGGIAVIDPRTHLLVDMIGVHECMPAGIAVGPNDQVLVGCSDDAVAAGYPAHSLIVDLRMRKVVATIKQVGGSDQVWYDRGSSRYYLAAVANPPSPVLGVVDAKRDAWVDNVKTGEDAHSVAADSRSGEIFVPVAANQSVKGCTYGCVEVFSNK